MMIVFRCLFFPRFGDSVGWVTRKNIRPVKYLAFWPQQSLKILL